MSAFEGMAIIVGCFVAGGLFAVAHAVRVHAQVNADVHNRDMRFRLAERREKQP